jgi:hypothetical protein
VPNDEFAAWLRELTGKPVNLYKVSVTCTAEELERWLARIEALRLARLGSKVLPSGLR